MSYNNQNSDPKPLPSTEYSLKNLSWHLKTISENLAKLTEHLTGQSTAAHSRGQRQQPQQNQQYNDNMPF
jgi:uncharacterized protein YdaU (DUF1376 family)